MAYLSPEGVETTKHRSSSPQPVTGTGRKSTLIYESGFSRNRTNRCIYIIISSVQSLSCANSFRPHGLQHARPPCPPPSPGAYSNSCPSHRDLILCRPLLLLPSIFPSIRVFSNELVLRIRWPKYWSFSFSISPSNEYSGLISFRMDWLDLLAVQGTLKVFSNTTVQKHQFFCAQLSLWSNSYIHT